MPVNKKKQSAFIRYAKLLITLGLCTAIVLKVDWNTTRQALSQANWAILLLVFVWMIINVFISTAKWKLLLAIHHIQFQFYQLLKYYLTAIFMNNFLPSTIGGDGYRILKTLKKNERKVRTIIAVFMERITGIMALLLIGFLGGIFGYWQSGDKISQLVMVSGIFGVVVIIALSLSIKIFKKPLKQLVNKLLPLILRENLDVFFDYRHQNRAILMIILCSFLFQFFSLFCRFLLVYSVDATIPLFDLAVVFTLSTIVALIPISINGFGLLDGSFIYLMTHFHVNYEQAFLVMILSRLLGFSLGLIGGVFYLSEKTFLGHKLKND